VVGHRLADHRRNEPRFIDATGDRLSTCEEACRHGAEDTASLQMPDCDAEPSSVSTYPATENISSVACSLPASV
jgi:hypothetical protein